MFRIGISFILALCMYSPSWGDGPVDHPPEQYDQKIFTEKMRISRGGQLYDNWWKTTDNGDKPGQNHPLWKLQNKNTRKGYSTWRCKECHGWDYRGKEGAYGKGSHYTGFDGVYEASQTLPVKELINILNGSTNKDHDFSRHLSDNDIADLALFLKKGTMDLAILLNSEGDYNAGRDFYRVNCMTECHGPEGMALNFGSEEKPQFIGSVAEKNPWEFIHKARTGQPGTRMSSGILNEWTDDDFRNLLTYSRSLPKTVPEPGWLDRIKSIIGLGKEKESSILQEHRGFGPKIDQ